MKGLRLFFSTCFALLAFQAVAVNVAPSASRTTNRRPTSTTTTARTAPQQSTRRSTTSRVANTQTIRQRVSNSTPENRALHTRTATTTPARSITTRAATTISPRTATPTNVTSATRTNTRLTNRGRSATESVPHQSPTDQDIVSRDPKKCREVFYGCMDEFCANKDAQLKRCACSTRINEFKGVQQSLNTVEEKLLDFGQRLLTVSMDKEDAAVLNQATAGELAFAQDDTSKSKKMLDEIAKKLNTSFNDSNFDQGLNAISLSLNTDAAFDSIDPTAGASTATKSGTALYSAALPVCREMAQEVCSPDELSIAEGGYQMLIEQDCNTVKKSYQAQSDTARAKVFESGALLDMSRLDVHQKRNSDDILTCKTKMLNMLTDSTVCGTDMGKCLDTSGQYIDPTTGDAILTPNLANLSNLILRPSDNQTWTTIPANSRYVTFLNSKKKFLEPAMENCQDISDYVWDLFVEDALSQIKIAQEKKLEQIRQSCTTLTAQCLDKTLESISEFDARALSIFGVQADKTANAMCADVKMACTALFQSTTPPGDNGNGDTATNDWESGITEITSTKTYETILSTCREVGRNCIIQTCTSITGNFGLCENISTSINRKAIINRTACWDEVYDCVASAGANTINQIMTQYGRITDKNQYGDLYATLYNKTSFTREPQYNYAQTSINPIYDICLADGKCTTEGQVTTECQICRIAEQIWGNCEHAPSSLLTNTNDHNQIYVMPKDAQNATLLSWFAHNTGTANAPDSCRDTTCKAGDTSIDGHGCVSTENITTDSIYCLIPQNKLQITDNITNCCITWDAKDGAKSNFIHSGFVSNKLVSIYGSGNDWCCNGANSKPQTYIGSTTGFNTKLDRMYEILSGDIDKVDGIGRFCGWSKSSIPSTPKSVAEIALQIDGNEPIVVDSKPITENSNEQYFALICTDTVKEQNTQDTFPSGKKLNCTSGKYVLVSPHGLVLDPFTVFAPGDNYHPYVTSYYYTNAGKNKCTLTYDHQTKKLYWKSDTETITCAAPKSWHVEYTSD